MNFNFATVGTDADFMIDTDMGRVLVTALSDNAIAALEVLVLALKRAGLTAEIAIGSKVVHCSTSFAPMGALIHQLEAQLIAEGFSVGIPATTREQHRVDQTEDAPEAEFLTIVTSDFDDDSSSLFRS
jgi:hypothetical protein